MIHEPLIAQVAVESGIHRLLDYLIPQELQASIAVGSLVEVPLRKGIERGIVVLIKNSSEFASKLRPLKGLSDSGDLPLELMQLANWVSQYYCCPLRRVLQVMMPKAVRDISERVGPLFVTRKQTLEQLAIASASMRVKHQARSKVLDIMLKVKTGILLSELLEKAEVSASPVQTLAKEGYLTIEPLPDSTDLSEHRYFPAKAKLLNDEQKTALKAIETSLDNRDGRVHLLFGVTGSGKTEVYLQAIKRVLESEGSCLLMVPEISLTPQAIDRLKARFDCPIAILHSRLTPRQRQKEWESIRSGHARLVVGARSSVFCPAVNLRLIIVDEEHESSYKSEESPHYHARDIAIERAKRLQATVILGSATPSLESYSRALDGRYLKLDLHQRATHASMPKVEIIDMLREYEKAGGYTLFSNPLLDQLKATLERGEQAMLFLNRRGYFAQTQCQKCGEALGCPHCDVKLTFHKSELKLVCHLCHFHMPVPIKCPHCACSGTLKSKGWGTEHVEASLFRWLPGVRTLRIDADTTRHKGSLEQMLRDFRTHKADVLIGTQMIAKGHHFPGLTLVGVLNPDSQLLQPDFRASEQLFQLLVQVFGRSGRSHLHGKVLVQTAQATAPLYQLAANHNFVAFAEQELQVRKLFGYPPYLHLIKVTLSGPKEEQVIETAFQLYQELLKSLPKSCMISSPGEGAWRKIQDSWRQVFLIKVNDPLRIAGLLEAARQKLATAQLHIAYDIDCQHIG